MLDDFCKNIFKLCACLYFSPTIQNATITGQNKNSSLSSSNQDDQDYDKEEDNEEGWVDGNHERRSHTRVAAVAVYGSVILIALFGILIKYFVTQYETLQAKAQMGE